MLSEFSKATWHRKRDKKAAPPRPVLILHPLASSKMNPMIRAASFMDTYSRQTVARHQNNKNAVQ